MYASKSCLAETGRMKANQDRDHGLVESKRTAKLHNTRIPIKATHAPPAWRRRRSSDRTSTLFRAPNQLSSDLSAMRAVTCVLLVVLAACAFAQTPTPVPTRRTGSVAPVIGSTRSAATTAPSPPTYL